MTTAGGRRPNGLNGLGAPVVGGCITYGQIGRADGQVDALRRTTARSAARVAEDGRAVLFAVGLGLSGGALPDLGSGTGFPLLAALPPPRPTLKPRGVAGAATDAASAQANAASEPRVAERTAALEADVADRGQAEGRLRRSQKIEAVGQLTGGIAHELDKPLTPARSISCSPPVSQGRHGDVDRYVGLARGRVLAEEGPHGFDLLHKPDSAEQLSAALRRAMAG